MRVSSVMMILCGFKRNLCFFWLQLVAKTCGMEFLMIFFCYFSLNCLFQFMVSYAVLYPFNAVLASGCSFFFFLYCAFSRYAVSYADFASSRCSILWVAVFNAVFSFSPMRL